MSVFRPLAWCAAALVVPAIPAFAAEIQIPVENPVVELTITETVQSAPDTANVGAGVTVRAPTAAQALRLNAEQMEKVIARLRQLGIAREDIQTANFSLNAQYRYNSDGTDPTFTGYDASNQVNVKLRSLEKLGATLDALVLVGANNVYGPNFSLEKDADARQAGRKAAFERGRTQAIDYARMAGFNGIRLLEVSETYAAMGPMLGGGGAIVVTSAKAESTTPVEPGSVGTMVTVTTKYEMTR